MSLRINHNLASLNGHRNMVKNDMAISKSLEKLSSGLRINRAADDAAGLIISEQMRAQISGLNQAVDNTETAVAMVQTAEGALDEMNTLLNKARELAVHAANAGANDDIQLAADQTELDNIITSITRIADNTQFGTKKVLDGTLEATSNYVAVANASVTTATIPATGDFLADGTYTLQVTQAYSAGTLTQATATSTMGGVNAAFDTVAATHVTAEASNIAAGATLDINGGTVDSAALDGSQLLKNTFTYTVTLTNGSGETYTDTLAGTGANSMADLLAAFNAGAGATNGASLAFDGAGVVDITFDGTNPNNAGFNGNGFHVEISENDPTTAAATATSVADVTSTGVDASTNVATDAALSSNSVLNANVTYTLRIRDGSGVQIGIAALTGDADQTPGTAANFGDLIADVNGDGGANYSVSFNNGTGQITVSADAGGIYDGALGNGLYAELVTSNGDVIFSQATSNGGVTGNQDAIAELRDSNGNAVAQLTVAANAANGTIVSNSELGITLDLDDVAAAALGSKGNILTTTTAQEGAIFQIGANRDQTVGISIASARASDLGLGALNITDTAASLDSLRTGAYLSNDLAQEAIAIIDKAINDVTDQRGNLGAIQSNTLESTLSSLRATLENTTAAESVIRDVDFAAESSIFTKNSILIQASTAMLAQANQLPQNVLKLLG